MNATLDAPNMGRKKTAKPSKTVRIDADVYNSSLIVAGFEGKDLGEYISDVLRLLVEKALLTHARRWSTPRSTPRSDDGEAMDSIWMAYATTFGWAIVGAISMALGNIIVLRVFDLSTPNVDEWELIKQGNIPIAIVFASMILALGYVIGSCVRP